MPQWTTMKERILTADDVRRLFDYDPGTGEFTRKVRTARCVRVGGRAGSVHPRGYVHIKIGRYSYAAHRLAWLYVHGEWPRGQIDHVNGQRSDNRLSNLRVCAQSENQQNTTLLRESASGLRGVGWHKASGKWRARISVAGVTKNLGTFPDRASAVAAYLQAKRVCHAFQPVPRDARLDH